MSEENALLEMVKSIDARTERLETKFDLRHDNTDGRLKSLETSRTAARAGMAGLAIAGTGGAAKMGIIDKLMSVLGGS